MDGQLDQAQREIVAEDTLTRVKEALDIFSTQIKAFAREALDRGFEKTLAEEAVPLFRQSILQVIDLADGGLATCDSATASALRAELANAKDHVESFLNGTVRLLMQTPTYLAGRANKIDGEVVA